MWLQWSLIPADVAEEDGILLSDDDITSSDSEDTNVESDEHRVTGCASNDN